MNILCFAASRGYTRYESDKLKLLNKYLSE